VRRRRKERGEEDVHDMSEYYCGFDFCDDFGGGGCLSGKEEGGRGRRFWGGNFSKLRKKGPTTKRMRRK